MFLIYLRCRTLENRTRAKFRATEALKIFLNGQVSS